MRAGSEVTFEIFPVFFSNATTCPLALRLECTMSLFPPPATPDLAFGANLSAFLQLALRQEDPDTLFFNRELSIEGDTELGLVVKNMLDAIEWPQLPKLPEFSH